MDLKNLNNILPVPRHVYETGLNASWPLIDEKYSFPKDYIEFTTQYGIGKIDNFLTLFNPFIDNDNWNFFKQKKWIISDFSELNESDPDYYSFILYPDNNGLLPIGITENGDYVFWVITSDNSDLWDIAVIATRDSDVEYHKGNLVSFIEGILSKKILSACFPKSFPSSNIIFDNNYFRS
ncbi:SMI1/KNR4 family protein [Proteus mirabilis]|uniref:SMI1/KNR4 family protein n=1 Tax=Proteus mirabilis TaxID=584 RepID=UPI000D74E5D4|nr:SMI1/KNR4 family protein [Proteus mirabilis]AWR58585.1 SMI1/KNR4 family protein [Proteus mirabilis]